MEGLSAQEKTKRRNSCLAAFQTCNDTTIPDPETIPDPDTAAVDIHFAE